jgi:hypothetical protein
MRDEIQIRHNTATTTRNQKPETRNQKPETNTTDNTQYRLQMKHSSMESSISIYTRNELTLEIDRIMQTKYASSYLN